ncbi:MAG: RsmB/NOP family class I SAM-dependent RNA methyltransferase [Bdellovibrionales bacterium]|nr:RsmB/NOP family class I SAM-dependent RNA methyltransferase [Bdellovibrionales bacterium]
MTKLKQIDFYAFYHDRWGKRWQDLYEALFIKEKQVLFSPFFEMEKQDEQDKIEWLPSCLWWTEKRQHWPFLRNEQGLLQFYVMDPASVLVARALTPQDGDKILDMCAAPGGKTLVLAQALGGQSSLHSNEPSLARRERLKKVIRQYVPLTLRHQIFIKGKDGLQYGHLVQTFYDRILVDAPCSGERHLLADKTELRNWKPSRIRFLAKKQYALLASGLQAGKAGSRLVYSTCTLNDEENDRIIQRLLKRKGDQVRVVNLPSPSPLAEKTDYGWIHLPDRCGFGPLYFSLLEKV